MRKILLIIVSLTLLFTISYAEDKNVPEFIVNDNDITLLNKGNELIKCEKNGYVYVKGMLVKIDDKEAFEEMKKWVEKQKGR